MGKIFDPKLILEYMPEIIKGLPTTLLIFALVLIISFGLGLGGSVIKLKKVPVITQLINLIASYTTNVPSVVQLYIIYYILPAVLLVLFGIDTNSWDPIVYVVVTFGVQRGVTLMEGIRAAILSVPKGQYEAAYAMGLTRFQTFFRIVFPQAFKIVLPIVEMLTCTLFKRTSVAYMIGVTDVMSRAIFAGARIGHNLEAFIAAALVFAALDLVFVGMFHFVEKHFRYGATRPA